jgi:hypothetical protein
MLYGALVFFLILSPSRTLYWLHLPRLRKSSALRYAAREFFGRVLGFPEPRHKAN